MSKSRETNTSGTMASETLLRRALTANASFSLLSALSCLLASGQIAGWTGVPVAELQSLGVELLLFGAGIFALLTRDLEKSWVRMTVGAIIALDVLWVVGSAALLLMPSPLTSAGQWTVGIVALVVADFAYFQWRGWRGMGRHAVGAAVADPA